MQRTLTLDVALGIFGEDEVGFSEGRVGAGIVDGIEEADEGAGTLPATGGEFVLAAEAREGDTLDGIPFAWLFAVADDHDSFGH